ncbi:MAG: hypothetical protein NW206_14365 [Hyphomonadaceae bacterium]|nr:hypothetical protein [Hyphomonadaceae bacterium]
MGQGGILVLDVGKTNAKLSLWSRDGRLLGAVSRANAEAQAEGYLALDVAGVRGWLMEGLRHFASAHQIDAIVPIAHGAAAAFVADGRLAAPIMSYETDIPPSGAYQRARDAFADTGSPILPNGLNLGAQLQHLSELRPDLYQGDAQIMPYPQFWAWVLSGVGASEVSSLGCHTDLWRVREQRFSNLADAAGWDKRFASVRRAADVLGPIRPEIAAETGLSPDCLVYCGAHDSNAAFYGARAHPMLHGRDVTVVSTGTWFVAMRAPKVGDPGPGDLSAHRDTLINVGVDGQLIPSARFMGGREMEALIGSDDSPMRTPQFAREIAPESMPEVFASGAMILPTFARGVGPFPDGEGRWSGGELQGAARRAAAGVYLALVTDASLSLIGARDAIVVEGRFAEDMSFLLMLAALRRDSDIYASKAEDGIAYGALRLVDSSFRPQTSLNKIEPVPNDISFYVARWRALAAGRA